MDGGKNFQMTEREEELESAKRVLFERMQAPQGHQSLSEIWQELRAIDAEMENLKKAGRRPGPFGSPF
jgi:oxalate decarboxylase/phosphoglucose isomerase-like protein (cupin superfamily)